MATRRVLKSVVHNFLGTYVSRDSDFDGYWLFGFLVGPLVSMEFDLLDRTASGREDPCDAAIRLASAKFAEQVAKSGLDPRSVREARLRIERLPGVVDGRVRGIPADGSKVRFEVVAVADTGLRCARARTLFVAPHDAAVELRSVRAI